MGPMWSIRRRRPLLTITGSSRRWPAICTLTRPNTYAAGSSTLQGARVLWVKPAPPILEQVFDRLSRVMIECDHLVKDNERWPVCRRSLGCGSAIVKPSSCARLFADEAGESHFEDIEVPMSAVEYPRIGQQDTACRSGHCDRTTR